MDYITLLEKLLGKAKKILKLQLEMLKKLLDVQDLVKDFKYKPKTSIQIV